MEELTKKIAIMDMDSILYSACYGNKIIIGADDLTNEPIYQRDELGRLVYQDKTEDEIIESINMLVSNILMRMEATDYIMFVKGKNTIDYRKELLPEYKSKRNKEAPKWWDFATNYIVKEFNAIYVDNWETDDAVVYTRNLLENAYIVAIDKDLLQTQGVHYNWRKEEWVSVSEIEADYYLIYDMIVGQPVDGIKGLPKKGSKFATKFLETVSRDMWFDQLKELYINHYGDDIMYNNTLNVLRMANNVPDDFIIPKPSKFNIGLNDISREIYGS